MCLKPEVPYWFDLSQTDDKFFGLHLRNYNVLYNEENRSEK